MAGGKLRRAIRASLGALLAPAENPLTTHADPIQRQRAVREQVLAATVGVQAARSNLENQRAAADRMLLELEQEAGTALVSGHEDLARNALRRRQATSAAIAQISQQMALMDGELHRLALLEQEIGSRLDAIAAREQLAAVRRSTAQAQIEVGEVLSGVTGELPGALAIEHLERDADLLEARAVAIDELLAAGVLGGPDRNSPRDAETDREVERQLGALKQKLGC